MSDEFKMNIIQLEIAELKERVIHAMAVRSADIERILKAQLDLVCTEEWITRIVNHQVSITMEECLRESINSYTVRSAMIALIERGLKENHHEKSNSGIPSVG